MVKGWSVWHVPRHTVPLGRSHSKLVAVLVSARGAPALALGVVEREVGPEAIRVVWTLGL